MRVSLGLCGWIRQAALCNGISVIFHVRQRAAGSIVVNHRLESLLAIGRVPRYTVSGFPGKNSPGNPLEPPRAPESPVNCLRGTCAFSPNGAACASAGGRFRRTEICRRTGRKCGLVG